MLHFKGFLLFSLSRGNCFFLARPIFLPRTSNIYEQRIINNNYNKVIYTCVCVHIYVG